MKTLTHTNNGDANTANFEPAFKMLNDELSEINDMDYLVGMKLTSARGQDLKDLADIIRRRDDLQPFELMSKLAEMKFDIDISILLDVFEGAFGMEWLDAFYRENEAELRKYF